MLNRLVIATVLVAGLLFGSAAVAVTSTPMPEEGFAVASSGHDSPTEPLGSPMQDEGGGADVAPARGPDGAAEGPNRDILPADGAAAKPTPTDHAHPATGADNAATGTGGSAHKARGNARWQSLLPGVMK